MNTMKKRRLLPLMFVLLLSLLIFCGTDEEEENPTLPSDSTMEIDIGIFLLSGTDTRVSNSIEYEVLSGNNFLLAKDNVIKIYEQYFEDLVIPIKIFKAAKNEEPKTVSNITTWSFKHKVYNVEYDAILIASRYGDGYNWELKVSYGNIVDFVYLSGHSNYSSTNGWWIFRKYNYDTSSTSDIVRVEWSFVHKDKYQNSFSNINDSYFGLKSEDYLEYSHDNNFVSMTFFDAHRDTSSGVDNGDKLTYAFFWNNETFEGGFITSDGNDFCWDSKENDRQDIPCEN